MKVALVNTNRIKPPIAPIGLEYIAESLADKGHTADILDLCWVEDPHSGITQFLEGESFDLVGITLRNTDDCVFTSRESFLQGFTEMVSKVRELTHAPIVIGGVGFSTMPEEILSACEADAGIWGDGEFVLPDLAERIRKKRDWSDLPNLILHSKDGWRRNPPKFPDLANLPLMSRRWVDNSRYFNMGGQAGIETKRGCPCECIYCADPVAKGRNVRIRPPKAVAYELNALTEQGIDRVHTCDSEFNIPEWHAISVCDEIIGSGLGNKLRWYAYCSPVPFSRELSVVMARAGCIGINFGVDSGDEGMLKRLKRTYSPGDILAAVDRCKAVKIPVMLDLLIGAPGETNESITRTIELMKKADPERVGVAIGVRVYPGTELSRMVMGGDLKDGLIGGEDPERPLFFLDPAIASSVFDLVDGLISDDRRFFFFDPERPERNYNYNANQILVEAIQKGYRGAYWDILRRFK